MFRDVHSAVCNRFGIRGYPTIKLYVHRIACCLSQKAHNNSSPAPVFSFRFQAGQPKDYSGQRTLEAFREFYQKAKDDESENEGEDHKDEL